MKLTLDLGNQAILRYVVSKTENDYNETLFVTNIKEPFKITNFDLRHLISALKVDCEYTSDGFMNALLELLSEINYMDIHSHHDKPLFILKIGDKEIKTTNINDLFSFAIEMKNEKTAE